MELTIRSLETAEDASAFPALEEEWIERRVDGTRTIRLPSQGFQI